MEFLKSILGDDLYAQVADKLKDSKIKLADLSTGEYVGKEKFDAEISRAKGLAEQLSEANGQIDAFKGMDIDGIKKSAEDWKVKAIQAESKRKADMEALQFDYALNGALGNAKAKNAKAVRALLDMDALTLNDGEIIGLSDQLEKIRSENDYLFDCNEAKPTFAMPTGGGIPKAEDNTLRAAMGLPTKE